nr:hypothetical protein Q903MT_gene67 [Picea sitchensis]
MVDGDSLTKEGRIFTYDRKALRNLSCWPQSDQAREEHSKTTDLPLIALSENKLHLK